MSFLFSSTLFISAMLLFGVQPMIAKMLLPFLGGAPAVWNTCMVFFQATLLAGYAYAHVSTQILGTKRQVVIHISLLLTALFFLPISIPMQNSNFLPMEINPSLWILICLSTVVGLPCFILSSTTPLLQHWFAHTRHRFAKDPYFLYASSNAGCMLALISYPVVLEPNLPLQKQSLMWAGFFLLLAMMFVLCALIIWRIKPASHPFEEPHVKTPKKVLARMSEISANLPLKQRLRWIVLAFIPSSLMLGVTNFFTSDIANIPLLWVIPLALYLLSFIIVFSRHTILKQRWMKLPMIYGALSLTYLLGTNTTEPFWILIPFHLAFFFIVSIVFHGQLANERPMASQLTEFYFYLSLGGVMGGLFNSLIAPYIFDSVAEYPIVVVLACLLNPLIKKARKTKLQYTLDFGLPLLLFMLTAGLIFFTDTLNFHFFQIRTIIFSIPIIFCYFFIKQRIRFALGLAAIMLCGNMYLQPIGKTMFQERNFFGVSRVLSDYKGSLHSMFNGNTLHGRQFTNPMHQCKPLSYYHQRGPLGAVMEAYNTMPAASRVAAIGLGAGCISSYALPNQYWTFYEIDPLVIRIAQDNRFFTYLGNCTAGQLELIVGDARLRISEAPDGHYGLIILDAFSSDIIPLHLLTKQAMALYLSKLAPNGIMAIHISNRHFDLAPAVNALAKNANLTCLHCRDTEEICGEYGCEKDPSHWTVLARKKENLGLLLADGARWTPVSSEKLPRVWSDDFCDIFSVLKWK